MNFNLNFKQILKMEILEDMNKKGEESSLRDYEKVLRAFTIIIFRNSIRLYCCTCPSN